MMTLSRMWGALEVMGKELGRLNLGRLKVMREYEERLRTDKLFFSHHHMGTTRMAINEDSGVVDRNLKVFNTNNFYIAGSSVFPTGSHVPPTLTIAALTIRLAEHLLEEASV
ncbi:GMC family oxidoreductase [Paraglaciecola sp. Hal342]